MWYNISSNIYGNIYEYRIYCQMIIIIGAYVIIFFLSIDVTNIIVNFTCFFILILDLIKIIYEWIQATI